MNFKDVWAIVEIEAPTQSYIPLIFCIYIYIHTHIYIYIQYIRVYMYILDVWASNLDTVMQRGRPQFHPSTFLWAFSFILLGTAKSASNYMQTPRILSGRTKIMNLLLFGQFGYF